MADDTTHQGPLPNDEDADSGRLEKEKMESNKWTPIWSGDGDGNRFEVQSWGTKVDVNLGSHTCTCRFWQLTGMPCMHACAAIAYKNQKPKDYCHGWLTLGSYNATYAFFVQPTQGEQYWTPTDFVQPIPPKVKRRAGRTKKQRRKDGNEDLVSNNRLKWSYAEWTCSRCGIHGHNSKGCNNIGVPQRPRNRKDSEPQQHEETQVEIDLSQSGPASQPIQSQEILNPTMQRGVDQTTAHRVHSFLPE